MRAVGRGARRAARLGEQQQREQPERLGFVGHELGEQTREPDRLRAEVGADQLVAFGRGVALVEDEVDDGEHGSEPARQLRVVGTRYGILASRIFCLARTSRFAIVASGTRNARAMYGVSSPPSRRSVSAICALGASAG